AARGRRRQLAAAQPHVLPVADRTAVSAQGGAGADHPGVARHRPRIEARHRLAGRILSDHRRYRRRLAICTAGAARRRAQPERHADADLLQSAVPGRAPLHHHRRQGRHHARRHRRGDRRVRRIKRGPRVPAAERDLADRYTARIRRPVRAVAARHLRLSAGGVGGTVDGAVAAAGAGEALTDMNKPLRPGSTGTKAATKPAARAKLGAKAPAKEGSLAAKAYAEIKEKIITLYFLPGQYLNEGAISALLQVGRTPVHQALQRLALEGLVEIMPRKGVIV